ncbi:unnamed protein product [Euphydryas editha]|uniref:Uncharacterized protein n=1 Tax=Euphydryas editha TaxID=104508 RepID=A0AAU9UCF6_EUPED|nr:unnamed protein product [Euphydryas editha]
MCPRTRPLRLLVAALALASCAAAPAPEPRAQRSANLSHITGTSRTIQIFLKNHYLQLMPDGTVNGTIEGNSVYSEYITLYYIKEVNTKINTNVYVVCEWNEEG